jgi:ABC-type uncharacterized transport system involved in gliding motility auxiliary subunit
MAASTENQSTGQARKPGLIGVSLALLAVLFIAINVLASGTLTTLRLDLTEERLYSLSGATKDLLTEIDEPITLRMYYSKELGITVPTYATYAKRVRDTLEEYANRSDGRVRVEFYEPEPFSDVEDRAVSYGLQGVPLNTSSITVYFGLVGTNTTDDLEIIPFLQPDREAFLEYDISRLVYKLSAPKRTVLGLISKLPIEGAMRMNSYGQQEPSPPYVVADQIREVFETEQLAPNIAKIPDHITLLLIAHPKGLDQRTLFAIDQFLLAGGKALILVDPFSETEAFDGQPAQGKTLPGSTLEPLFSTWGLKMDLNSVVGDRLTSRRVSPGQGQRLVDYVAWLMLRGPNIDKTTPITSGVDSIAMASTGHLELAEDASVTMTPLLVSSPGAMSVSADKVKGFRDPKKLLREYKAGDKRFVMAARVTGSVKTAFPDGVPKPPEDDDAPKPAEEQPVGEILTESKVPLDVIVIADTDVLGDRFWVTVQDFFGRRLPTPLANNGVFIVNALDSLAGGSALLGLRGEGTATRPFTVVQIIQREAARKFEAKERKLQKTLQNTQKKLDELQKRTPEGSAAVLSEKDRKTMQNYQRKVLTLRGELRAVQRSVAEDMEKLELRLWFFNIVLVPVLVAFAALVLAAWRVRRRAQRTHEAAA